MAFVALEQLASMPLKMVRLGDPVVGKKCLGKGSRSIRLIRYEDDSVRNGECSKVEGLVMSHTQGQAVAPRVRPDE